MRRLIPLLLALAAASPGADRELLKLVMPDARVLSGIQVAQVKKTPFGQFVLAEFSASQDSQFDGFVKASGFDPRNDIHEVLIAAAAGQAGDRKLIVVRGTFDPARILEIARSAGGTVESYRGVDILSNGPAAASSPHGIPLAVAFLSGTLAAAGDLDTVRGAVDRRDNGTGPSPDMLSRADAVSAASDAWFVSKVPVAELAQGMPGSNLSGALQGDALKSIEQASGGAIFGIAVKVSAELVTRTPADATSLADVLRFLAGLLRTGPQQPLFSALDLKTEGKTLKLDGSIPEAQLESLLKQAGK